MSVSNLVAFERFFDRSAVVFLLAIYALVIVTCLKLRGQGLPLPARAQLCSTPAAMQQAIAAFIQKNNAPNAMPTCAKPHSER